MISNHWEERLHEAEWPVDEAGYFIQTKPPLLDDSPCQAAARVLADELVKQFKLVCAVYLRGSALESHNLALIRDVDIVVVIVDDPSDPSALKVRTAVCEFANTVWHPHLPPCDISCILQSALGCSDNDILAAMLILRAQLLAGECDAWIRSPRIHAGKTFAQNLWSAHLTNTDRIWSRTSDPGKEMGVNVRERFVPWFQKRALRSGGIEALARIGRFSLHPRTCTRLIGDSVPECAPLAIQVFNDYINQHTTINAYENAANLLRKLVSQSVLHTPSRHTQYVRQLAKISSKPEKNPTSG